MPNDKEQRPNTSEGDSQNAGGNGQGADGRGGGKPDIPPGQDKDKPNNRPDPGKPDYPPGKPDKEVEEIVEEALMSEEDYLDLVLALFVQFVGGNPDPSKEELTPFDLQRVADRYMYWASEMALRAVVAKPSLQQRYRLQRAQFSRAVKFE